MKTNKITANIINKNKETKPFSVITSTPMKSV